MVDLMELDYKDLNIAGLQMLVAGKISTICVNCGKPAEDVLVSKLVGNDFQIRLTPVCRALKEGGKCDK